MGRGVRVVARGSWWRGVRGSWRESRGVWLVADVVCWRAIVRTRVHRIRGHVVAWVPLAPRAVLYSCRRVGGAWVGGRTRTPAYRACPGIPVHPMMRVCACHVYTRFMIISCAMSIITSTAFRKQKR